MMPAPFFPPRGGKEAAMEQSALREQLAAVNQVNTTAFEAKKAPKRFQWNPQEDMTAYELALLMPIYAGANIEDIVRVNPSLRRHLLEMV